MVSRWVSCKPRGVVRSRILLNGKKHKKKDKRSSLKESAEELYENNSRGGLRERKRDRRDAR